MLGNVVVMLFHLFSGGHAKAQVVRLLQRPRFNPTWHQEKFSLGTSAFPYHHYSTNGPYSYPIHRQLMPCGLCTALLNETLPYLCLTSLPELFFSRVRTELILIFASFPGFQILLAPTSAG